MVCSLLEIRRRTTEISFYEWVKGLRLAHQKKIVIFAELLSFGVILLGAPLNSSHCYSEQTPRYAGIREIESSKKHFIVVGDTQRTSLLEFWRERNDRERKLLIDEIIRREPAFVLHLGDLTTRGSSKRHWLEFDALHKAFREKRIPYFPILGNHELYGNDKKALQHYFGRFPELEDKRWYSFRWNHAGFVMVDSNFQTLTEEEVRQQNQWYLSELEGFEGDREIECVIVCCHEPPFTNSRVVKPNKKVKLFFADSFLRFRKSCLFFSGHNHSYERFETGGKLFIVSGGGGGPRHKVSIDPAKEAYKDLFVGPELRFFHFCQIETHNREFVFKVIRLDAHGIFNVVDLLTIVTRDRAGTDRICD
jgi:hypothetical protein